MIIRNANHEDVQAITELAQNCAPNLRPSVFGTYEYFTYCFRSTFFVFEEDNEIKGFIVGFPNIDVKGEYWLYQICVHSSIRSKNVGSKIIVPFIEKIKEMGYTHIKSHANNQHSKNLHEKFGFKEYDQDQSGWFMKLEF
ncbi:MAG: GNAT family N-acetyltransferase [Candidatus Helarchaeota archaeon]